MRGEESARARALQRRRAESSTHERERERERKTSLRKSLALSLLYVQLFIPAQIALPTPAAKLTWATFTPVRKFRRASPNSV